MAYKYKYKVGSSLVEAQAACIPNPFTGRPMFPAGQDADPDQLRLWVDRVLSIHLDQISAGLRISASTVGQLPTRKVRRELFKLGDLYKYAAPRIIASSSVITWGLVVRPKAELYGEQCVSRWLRGVSPPPMSQLVDWFTSRLFDLNQVKVCNMAYSIADGLPVILPEVVRYG